MNGTRRPPAGAAFAFDLGREEIAEQLDTLKALDTRTGILLAAEGIVASLLFTRASVFLHAPRALGIPAALALFASLLLSLLAFARRWPLSAPASGAVARMATADDEWLRWRFLWEVLLAVNVNYRILGRKERLLTASLAALIVTVGLAGGYFVYKLMAGVGS